MWVGDSGDREVPGSWPVTWSESDSDSEKKHGGGREGRRQEQGQEGGRAWCRRHAEDLGPENGAEDQDFELLRVQRLVMRWRRDGGERGLRTWPL